MLLPRTDPYATPEVRLSEPNPYRWTGLELNVARRALDHSEVCLSGLGGDPLLWFSPWYWVEWVASGHPAWPERAARKPVLIKAKRERLSE